MILAAAAAIAASSPATPGSATRATAQATATIRIVSATRVRLGEQPPSGSALRRSTVRTAAGPLPARLIEFQ